METLQDIRPVNDVVVVRVDDEPEKIGSIWIPDIARDRLEQLGSSSSYVKGKTHKATVLAAGPGKWMPDGEYRRPMSVKRGDRILLGQYADFGHGNIAAIREDDIIGLI